MTNVRIPPTLRAQTDGRRDVEVAGETVGDVLSAIVAAFPALDGRLLDKGRVQPFVNLFLDGTDVRALDGLDTAVDEGSTLLLLPAMAGGERFVPSFPPGRGKRPVTDVGAAGSGAPATR